MGVILAIEPVWKHIVSDADRARTVLDEIGSPNLQVILDPVNLISPARYQQRNETIAHAIEVLGRDVAVLHLKDCRLERGEVDQQCLRYRGT
jgi:sugar phosphate isomerase/epimerase